MAIREIRLYGDDILRKKAKPVTDINKRILCLLDDMGETLREKEGLGLAAPQVGVLRRVAVLEIDEEIFELINPEIVEVDGLQKRNEACLSIPGKSGEMDRPMHIKVEATNRKGEKYILEGSELKAAAICHELDHLDGILFIDYAKNIKDNEDDGDE